MVAQAVVWLALQQEDRRCQTSLCKNFPKNDIRKRAQSSDRVGKGLLQLTLLNNRESNKKIALACDWYPLKAHIF